MDLFYYYTKFVGVQPLHDAGGVKKGCNITELMQSCNYHISALLHICPLLMLVFTRMVALGILAALLEYYNSLLCGTSCDNLQK